MLNLDELWIGDLVQIISTGKVGKYEGQTKDGMVKVKHYNKLLLTRQDDLRKYYASQKEVTIEIEDVEKETPAIIEDVIDLHIDVLNPQIENERPERILDYQIKAFEKYLGGLKKSVINEATIIHGKGEGVLSGHILSIIKNDKSIKHYEVINNGGAVRILI